MLSLCVFVVRWTLFSLHFSCKMYSSKYSPFIYVSFVFKFVHLYLRIVFLFFYFVMGCCMLCVDFLSNFAWSIGVFLELLPSHMNDVRYMWYATRNNLSNSVSWAATSHYDINTIYHSKPDDVSYFDSVLWSTIYRSICWMHHAPICAERWMQRHGITAHIITQHNRTCI